MSRETAAPGAGPATSPPAAVYTDSLYGFRMRIPAGVTPRPDFSSSYLASAQWKAYAGPDSQGVPRLALALPGSNQITSAELRIGVSDAAPQVKRCAQPPEGMAEQVEQVSINGIGYTRFRAQDAAMNHYLVVDAYRSVHAGRCYALDLMVYGVNPQVYSPPATPPFSQDQALRQLRAWLDGFAFVR
ncbi:MAG TPA: hypothetical protein VEA17_17695 [Bordetella sp.]|nr:hypothetical protein [Bordetella sp.]